MSIGKWLMDNDVFWEHMFKRYELDTKDFEEYKMDKQAHEGHMAMLARFPVDVSMYTYFVEGQSDATQCAFFRFLNRHLDPGAHPVLSIEDVYSTPYVFLCFLYAVQHFFL